MKKILKIFMYSFNTMYNDIQFISKVYSLISFGDLKNIYFSIITTKFISFTVTYSLLVIVKALSKVTVNYFDIQHLFTKDNKQNTLKTI